MAKAAGNDEERQDAQRRINQLSAKYASFSKASGLPTRAERLNVKGFKSVKISEKPFTNGKKGDIIKKTGAVPASRYVNSADALFKNAKNIKPISGYEDIVIHGDRFGFEVRNKDGQPAYTYTVREFAEILKTDPTYTGGAIRLISCEAGAIDNGAAQMLANQLGVNVLAPSDIIWVYPDGEIIIGPEPSKNIGAWRLFKPKGK